MIWRVWGQLLAGMEEAVGSRAEVGRSPLALIEVRHRADWLSMDYENSIDPDQLMKVNHVWF